MHRSSTHVMCKQWLKFLPYMLFFLGDVFSVFLNHLTLFDNPPDSRNPRDSIDPWLMHTPNNELTLDPVLPQWNFGRRETGRPAIAKLLVQRLRKSETCRILVRWLVESETFRIQKFPPTSKNDFSLTCF